MKNLQRVRTRRQLLRVTAVGAASFPVLALARKSASAQKAPTPAPTTSTNTRTKTNIRQLLFEGYEDFNSFGRSSSAGTANWR